MQGNLANTYSALGREEETLSMRREVYSGHLNLNGEEDFDTLRIAFNICRTLGLWGPQYLGPLEVHAALWDTLSLRIIQFRNHKIVTELYGASCTVGHH